MSRSAPQLHLALDATPAPAAEKLPPPTDEEKRITRIRQGWKCKTCGNEQKGRALDVVRGPGGVLLAFCRRDRLRFDAGSRCRKGAAKRRRGTTRKVKRPEGQRKLREIA